MTRAANLAITCAILLAGCGTSQPRAAGYESDVTAEALVVPRPEYPESARKSGIQGRVLVRVTVGIQGEVTEAEVAETSGNTPLDQAAVNAAFRARFKPALKDGRPTSFDVRIPYEFRLDDSPKATPTYEDARSNRTGVYA